MINKIQNILINKWNTEGGYREFINIAFPLVLSTGTWSIQHFIDRMFLTWHSPSAVAAAMPAGMLNFTLMSLFLGTVGYVDTFVAQYYGAKQNKNIGPVIWQGIYISFIGSIVISATIPLSDRIFSVFGHEEVLRNYETVYYKILCLGSFPALASSAIAGFYAGRGKTWTVMWVNIAATVVNSVLGYILIFGKLGFPEMGIKGAGIAAVMSAVTTFFIYFGLILKKDYVLEFNTSLCKINADLMKRILKYGFPNGVQFFLDIAGFTAFVIIIGKMGTIDLAATNIALNINTIAFMPMIGCGITVSVLVGQYLGMNRPDIAQKSVYTGFGLTFFYMSIIAAIYYFFPYVFIGPFAKGSNPEEFTKIAVMVAFLLKFVAFYSIFDTMNIVFASAVKGAGDTRFVMYILFFISLFVLVVPSYLAVYVFHKGLTTVWFVATAYVCILGLAFYFRFLSGKWKSMRVIECPEISCAHTNYPEVPLK